MPVSEFWHRQGNSGRFRIFWGARKYPWYICVLWTPFWLMEMSAGVCLTTPREGMSYRRTGEDEGGKYKRVEEAHLSNFGRGAGSAAWWHWCVGTSQARSSCHVTIGRVISFAILSWCNILPRLWVGDHGRIPVDLEDDVFWWLLAFPHKPNTRLDWYATEWRAKVLSYFYFFSCLIIPCPPCPPCPPCNMYNTIPSRCLDQALL